MGWFVLSVRQLDRKIRGKRQILHQHSSLEVQFYVYELQRKKYFTSPKLGLLCSSLATEGEVHWQEQSATHTLHDHFAHCTVYSYKVGKSGCIWLTILVTSVPQSKKGEGMYITLVLKYQNAIFVCITKR
jgi:hypothetical protein